MADGFAIDLHGDLAGILRVAQCGEGGDAALSEEHSKSLPEFLSGVGQGAEACMGTMVAGARKCRSHTDGCDDKCMGTMVAGTRNVRSHTAAPEGAQSECMGTMVAGAGFEPATFRL